jgi:hypothetical protein
MLKHPVGKPLVAIGLKGVVRPLVRLGALGSPRLGDQVEVVDE